MLLDVRLLGEIDLLELGDLVLSLLDLVDQGVLVVDQVVRVLHVPAVTPHLHGSLFHKVVHFVEDFIPVLSGGDLAACFEAHGVESLPQKLQTERVVEVFARIDVSIVL